MILVALFPLEELRLELQLLGYITRILPTKRTLVSIVIVMDLMALEVGAALALEPALHLDQPIKVT